MASRSFRAKFSENDNPLQFNYIVSLLNVGLTFCHILPNVMGYNIGFTTQLINVAVGGKFDQVQGMAHQLNLIIKAGLQEIAKYGYLALFEVAMTIIR